MSPDDLAELLDEERGDRYRTVTELTVADRLDADEKDRRRFGGLL